MKKLRRISRRPDKPANCPERPLDKCKNCANPLVSNKMGIQTYEKVTKNYSCCRDQNANICYVKSVVEINVFMKF